MSTASERAKERRSPRLEFLESRNLLSVVAPKAIAAEVSTTPAPVTTITGRVHGSMATAGLYVPTQANHRSLSGFGTSRPTGNLLFSSQQVQATTGSTVAISGGDALFTTHRGDQIYVKFTGTGTATTHRPTTFSLTGTVTSGTRRFLGETGTFVATGTQIPSTGKFNFSFTINFSKPSL